MFWKLLAEVASIPRVAQWLYRRAVRTPYLHIMSADGKDTYMGRWWLFNPYDPETRSARFPRLPSVRLHHICRRDQDRHPHDHPWPARTIILAGCYTEERHGRGLRTMLPGETAAINPGEYHRIVAVHPGGAWTLFITWGYTGTWGFLVDGKKVPHKEYLS